MAGGNAFCVVSYKRLDTSSAFAPLGRSLHDTMFRGRGRAQENHSQARSDLNAPDGVGSDAHMPATTSDAIPSAPEQSPLGSSPSTRTYSSANHLLNFPHYSYSQHGRGRGHMNSRGRGGHRRPAAKPMPYNRNKFLQANFRFLVSDAGNLRKHEADADLMLDWDSIVQVCASRLAADFLQVETVCLASTAR